MEAQTPSRALAVRLWRAELAPRWPWLALAALLTAITAAAASAYAFVAHWAVGLLESRDPSVLWLAPVVVIAVAAVRGVSLYLQTIQTNRIALKVMQSLQQAMYARLVTADFARLASEPVGALISRFINDITLLREALVRAANNLLRDTLTIAGALAAMFYFDWLLALFVLVVYPLAAIPVTRIGRALRRTATKSQTQMGEVTSFLEESFSGARMVKAYGLEAQEQDRARTAFLDRYRLLLSMTASKARVDPLLEVFGGIAFAGVLAFAGWRAVTGEAGVAEFVGFIAAIGVMAPAVRALGTLSAVMQEGFSVLARVYAVLDETDRVTEAAGAAPLKVTKGAVKLEGVGFSYGEAAPALHGVDIEIPAGKTVALVGPSGSGKTTVLNLIPRLYDPQAGRILIDGQDIRGVTLSSLRGAMALVSQDAVLFDDTVKANIAFGRPDAADAEVEAAAAAADAHDFIMALPGGYDARVGPKGNALSGGQRQRIAIARAILRDAPVLLLDEATSALDAESETRVQQALERLSQGRTTLVIAHRLSTVRAADRIYVLDGGRVAESGRHDDLLAKNGLYARLCRLQFGE
ncbi:MAG: ABC transporter ATP-binding protein [Maricaulaceae bacterium]|nr:ABC transporter ATP-binding protein [Maricaulaceae bacterium]